MMNDKILFSQNDPSVFFQEHLQFLTKDAKKNIHHHLTHYQKNKHSSTHKETDVFLENLRWVTFLNEKNIITICLMFESVHVNVVFDQTRTTQD